MSFSIHLYDKTTLLKKKYPVVHRVLRLEQLRQAFDSLDVVDNALLMKVCAVWMLTVGIGEVSIERLPNVTDAPFDYLCPLLL